MKKEFPDTKGKFLRTTLSPNTVSNDSYAINIGFYMNSYFPLNLLKRVVEKLKNVRLAEHCVLFCNKFNIKY